jgi:hypothetical protein
MIARRHPPATTLESIALSSEHEPLSPSIRRKQRRYTTGRNQQLNFKATPQTVERLYRIADERKLTLCQTLELALDALECSSGSK